MKWAALGLMAAAACAGRAFDPTKLSVHIDAPLVHEIARPLVLRLLLLGPVTEDAAEIQFYDPFGNLMGRTTIPRDVDGFAPRAYGPIPVRISQESYRLLREHLSTQDTYSAAHVPGEWDQMATFTVYVVSFAGKRIATARHTVRLECQSCFF